MLYIKQFYKILLVFVLFHIQILIKADFQFGRLIFDQADEVSASIIIPGVRKAIICLQTRYPSLGFHLGLYDINSCDHIWADNTCVPTLLQGFFERELNLRPDPKPKLEWVGGANNKFLFSGYIRKEIPTCRITQFTVGAGYDVIEIVLPDITINCNGDFPSQPQILMWYVANRNLLYIKDYDTAPAIPVWRIRQYDVSTNLYKVNEHTVTDDTYIITVCQRDNVTAPRYIYYEHDATGIAQWQLYIKDLDQSDATILYTVDLKINHAQIVESMKKSNLLAVVHYDSQIVIYNWASNQIEAEFYFEVYFPMLEHFKAIQDIVATELLLVGSKQGNDRYLRWLTIDNTGPTYDVFRGVTMSLDDTYTYQFQEAISYDPNQNLLFYMSAEQEFSIRYIQECQGGHTEAIVASPAPGAHNDFANCSDILCPPECQSCNDAQICSTCNVGYTLDDVYTCQPDASRGNGQTVGTQESGMFMGHPNNGEYFYDSAQNKDTILIYDFARKWIHRFQSQTEQNDYIDASTEITNELVDMIILRNSQHILSVEFDGTNYQFYKRLLTKPLGAPVGGPILTDPSTHPTPPITKPIQLLEIALVEQVSGAEVQHVVYRKDDGTNNQFWVVNVLNGEEIRIQTDFIYPLPQTSTPFVFSNADLTDKVFFFGYSGVIAYGAGGGNILLVKDDGGMIHTFDCVTQYPAAGLTCTDTERFYTHANGGVGLRIDHIPGTQYFINYNVNQSNVAIVRQFGLTGGFPTPAGAMPNLNFPANIKAGIYFENTDGATIRVFATITEDGQTNLCIFNAAINNLSQGITSYFGYKYYNRDVAGTDFVVDQNTFMGWEQDTMTVMIKSENTIQKINLCGLDQIYDSTRNFNPFKCRPCNGNCVKCFLNGGGTTTANDCLLCSFQTGGPTFIKTGATTCGNTCGGVNYIADRFRECRACEHQCATCANDANACTACKGDRGGAPNCNCPANYYDDGFSLMCQICDPNLPTSCILCIDYVCRDCVLNLSNVDLNHLCECNDALFEYTHNIAFTQWCTTCTAGQYQAQLNNEMRIITVEFFTTIQFNTFDAPKYELSQDVFTYELCVHMLDPATLAQVGEVPKCRRAASTTAIEISFGYLPTLLAGWGNIQFTNNSINRPECAPNQFFNTHNEQNYLDSLAPETPIISLEGPSFVTICEDFDVYILQEQLEGRRELRNIVWSTTSGDPVIINVMTYYTNQQAHYFTMPAMFLDVGQTYTFNVVYENYQGIVGASSITVSTFPEPEGPHIKMAQENYQTFYTSDIISFQAELSYIKCDRTTFEVEYVPDQTFATTWQLIDSNTAPSDLQTIVNNKNQFIEYTFNSHARPPYEGYGIILKSLINNVEAISRLNFNVVEYPQLMCYIVGGGRVESYSNIITIDAKVKNLDVTSTLQDLGVVFVWDCKDLTTFQPCQKNDGTILTFVNQGTIQIPAKTLRPYQSLKFRVTASITSPSVKECIYEVIINITAMETPLQLVNFPEHIQAGLLNFHDVIQLDIPLHPTLTADDVQYDVVFLYKDKIVAKHKSQYNSLNIRVLDFFENIIVTDPYITMIISIQTPSFYMPSQNLIRLYMNYVPQNGILQVSDVLTGVAMETVYTFQATQFTDSDQDISYRFSFYLSESYYNQDVKNGYDPFHSEKNVVCDFSPRSICNTRLPLPLINSVSNLYKAVIMVEAQDLLGGIANRTDIITVNPSSNSRLSQLNILEKEYRNAHVYTKSKKILTFTLVAQQLRQMDESGCLLCSGNGLCNSFTNKCECNKGFYMRDCSFNYDEYMTYAKLKMEVYQSLKNMRDFQFLYINEENSVKGMSKILDDIYIGQALNNTFVESFIQDMGQYVNVILKERIDKLQEDQVVNQANSPYQLKIDSIQRILKHCFYSIDSVSYAVYNAEFNGELIFTQFQKLRHYKLLVNLTRDVSMQLHNIGLPNDKTFDFLGNVFNTKTQVLSPKKIIQEVLDFDQEIDQVNFKQNLYDVEGDGVFKIYNSMIQGYIINPYQKEPSYPYPDQDTVCQDVDIYQKGMPDEEITPAVRVRYEFEALNQVNSTWNLCITRRYNGVWIPPIWNIEDCDTSYVIDGNSKLQVICSCKTLNPVSVINDYLCLFRDCFPELPTIKWYYSLMLYTLIAYFLTFVYLLWKAFAYDRVFMHRVIIEVPEDKSSSEEEEPEKPPHDRLQVENIFQYLEGSKRNKIQRKKVEATEGEEVIAIDRGGRTEIDKDQIVFDDEFVEIYKRMNPFKAIYKLHELLEIYFFYDPDCKRIFRVLYWYSKYMMQCSIIGYLLFNRWLFSYIVLVCVLFACCYDPFIGFIKFLMRIQKLSIKLISFNLVMISLFISWYFIIENEIWLYLYRSNEWAHIFLLMFLGDTLILQPFLIVVKCLIVNAAIGYGNKFAMFIKWLFIFYEENLFFRNLLRTAKLQFR